MSLLSQGYQYLTETRFDQMEPVLEILRRDIVARRGAEGAARQGGAISLDS